MDRLPRALVALTTSVLLAAVTGVGRAADAPAPASGPHRLKRADSYLGIHFDFHAGPDCTEIGRNTTREMVDRIIDQVHPDFLQVDCKGHPGLSSYPTKVGNPAPGFVGNPLRVWREATAARGVALYVHYSGILDYKAAATHPDWAVLNPDGKPDARTLSPFGPYADQLLVPQLRELAGDYGIDGAWVDGECWAAKPDYGPAALAALRRSAGIIDAPRGPDDDNWVDFLQFQREAFRDYLRHYVAEVKRNSPDFQVCSNWAFTDHMPGPVTAPVDFLSGDYTPEDSVNAARLSARYLARQGKPWDLMAWSFTTRPQRRQKGPVQIEREAAVVLALGGGFQAYYRQKRDGSIYDEQMPVMAEVAKFCRERQAVCQHAEAVPQVGLLFSAADQYRRMDALFPHDVGRISGVLQPLLESQLSVEVLGEHQLAGRMSQYPVLVVPECRYLDPAFRDSLVDYVKSGGNLLLVGPDSARLFEKELGESGTRLEGEPREGARLLWTSSHEELALRSRLQAAAGDGGVVPFCRVRAIDDPAGAAQPAATIGRLGKGKIAVTTFDIARPYLKNRPAALRHFVGALVRQLFPGPLVEVTGSADVDVCVARNHGNLLVNLVNTSGPHQTQSLFEEISPVGPLEVKVREAEKPAAVTLEPGGRPLEFGYQDGQVHVTVPAVPIQEIVVVKEK